MPKCTFDVDVWFSAVDHVAHAERAEPRRDVGAHGSGKKADLEPARAGQHVRVRRRKPEHVLVVEFLEREIESQRGQRAEMHEQESLSRVAALEIILGFSNRHDRAAAKANAQNGLWRWALALEAASEQAASDRVNEACSKKAWADPGI